MRPEVLAARRRLAGKEGRRPPQQPGEVYGPEQLEADLRANRCPAHGCEHTAGETALMCRGHWGCVPSDVRREVMESVRAINALARRYDAADAGQQDRLAPLYLEAEDSLREAQLRAVIVASERSGAR